MADLEDVDERLCAVERALTDTDQDLTALETNAALAERVDTLEERIEELTARVDDLDASTQAVRGYVGNVRSVERDVERRADAALAAVETLEARLDDLEQSGASAESGTSGGSGGDGEGGAADGRRTGTRAGAGEPTGTKDPATDAQPGEASPERIARRVVGDSAAPARAGRPDGTHGPGERHGAASEEPTADDRVQTNRGRPRPSDGDDEDDGLLADIRDAL